MIRLLVAALLITLALNGVQYYIHDAYKERVAQSQAKAAQLAREKEEGWRQGITQWVVRYVGERERREEELNRTISGLKSGSLRVKPRLSCAPPTSPGSNGGEAGGLSAEDAEFLLREAARADALAEQLKLLQEYVKEITGG